MLVTRICILIDMDYKVLRKNKIWLVDGSSWLIFLQNQNFSHILFLIKLKSNTHYLFNNKNSCNKYFQIKRSELTYFSLKRITLWLPNPTLWMRTLPFVPVYI